jgi:predicted ester cyclase
MSDAIPPVLLRYVEGLERRDVAQIASTVADAVDVVTPTRTLAKSTFLAFLTALYRAFPDWHYDHDAPEACEDGSFAVCWRQGGTHTMALELAGQPPLPATGKRVQIPAQQFFYKIADGQLVEIRPDPIPGGAPWGILEQLAIA